MADTILMLSGISGALAVILGAFGAHALKKKLDTDRLAVFATGVEYHFYHTFALAAVGLSMRAPSGVGSELLEWAAICFAVGIVMFSGSLYLLATKRNKLFGPITPLGGLFLIAGWSLFALQWAG